jgi:hypothetical protein
VRDGVQARRDRGGTAAGGVSEVRQRQPRRRMLRLLRIGLLAMRMVKLVGAPPGAR